MRYRHYKYTVMLFGLKNTPATFQRLINNMLREYLDDFAITYLDENLKRGFIRPSKSSTEYSILFVSKKNETKQLCVNYRQLNKIIKQDSYPLPLIEELQDQLDRVK